jgi:hypothetical protein
LNRYLSEYQAVREKKTVLETASDEPSELKSLSANETETAPGNGHGLF